MSTPTTPASLGHENDPATSDQRMVFQSFESSPPMKTEKKLTAKAAKAKIKLRKSTPAPPSKGNGRKRLDLSPYPEDKQLRKRIDFGEESGLISEEPRCKGAIFSGYHLQEVNNGSLDKKGLEIVLYCSASSGENGDPLPSVSAAGDDLFGVPEKDRHEAHSRSKTDDPTNANEVLNGEIVNLPVLDMETKLLSESTLVTRHFEGSQDALAVGLPMQPKKDNILQLASPNAAQMLDTMVAQPLLSGGQPEGDRTFPGQLSFPSPAISPSVPIFVAANQNLAESSAFNGMPSPHAGDQPPEVQMGGDPSPNQAWANSLKMPNPITAYIPPLEDFPPLVSGRTLKIRDSYEAGAQPPGKGAAWSRDSSGRIPFEGVKSAGTGECGIPASLNTAGGSVDGPSRNNKPRIEEERHKEIVIVDNLGSSSATGAATTTMGSSGGTEEDIGNTNKPKSMAEMLRERPDPNGPQVFVSGKIQNIGFATLSKGLPAIYFSGAEIKKLEDNVGHAIVGKFSHSIPASHQIQKSLDNIKFKRGCSWKYINAKHILIQFEDLADYARLLDGPKGTPVWYIDRHPMRVFKWTSEFDAYCESPIAAVWCSLISLPIHLFDQSALFAIGKLLGTPIQVDRATADKSRLSFAKICVEIDITKPPPEEIILDICGREVVQQVRWAKIPSYCRECKHVGHTSDVCYATGKVERPQKRNYHSETSIPKQQAAQDEIGKQGQPTQNPSNNEWKRQGKNRGTQGNKNSEPKGKGPKNSDWRGPDVMADPYVEHEVDPGDQDGRGGRGVEGGDCSRMGSVSIPNSHGGGFKDDERGYNRARRGTFSFSRGGSRGAGRHSSAGGRGDFTSWNSLSSNQYYSLMANGDYDTEDCGEAEVTEMDVQPPDGAQSNVPTMTDGENNCKIVELHGGTSSSPGTDLIC